MPYTNPLLTGLHNAHQQEQTKPADYQGACVPGQGLIQLMGVERAVEMTMVPISWDRVITALNS